MTLPSNAPAPARPITWLTLVGVLLLPVLDRRHPRRRAVQPGRATRQHDGRDRQRGRAGHDRRPARAARAASSPPGWSRARTRSPATSTGRSPTPTTPPQGLADGTYQAVITIPTNFSAAATSTAPGGDAASRRRSRWQTPTGLHSSSTTRSPRSDADRGIRLSARSCRRCTSRTCSSASRRSGDQLGDGRRRRHELADGAQQAADGAAALPDGITQLGSGAVAARHRAPGRSPAASTIACGRPRHAAAGAGQLAAGLRQAPRPRSNDAGTVGGTAGDAASLRGDGRVADGGARAERRRVRPRPSAGWPASARPRAGSAPSARARGAAATTTARRGGDGRRRRRDERRNGERLRGADRSGHPAADESDERRTDGCRGPDAHARARVSRSSRTASAQSAAGARGLDSGATQLADGATQAADGATVARDRRRSRSPSGTSTLADGLDQASDGPAVLHRRVTRPASPRSSPTRWRPTASAPSLFGASADPAAGDARAVVRRSRLVHRAAGCVRAARSTSRSLVRGPRAARVRPGRRPRRGAGPPGRRRGAARGVLRLRSRGGCSPALCVVAGVAFAAVNQALVAVFGGAGRWLGRPGRRARGRDRSGLDRARSARRRRRALLPTAPAYNGMLAALTDAGGLGAAIAGLLIWTGSRSRDEHRRRAATRRPLGRSAGGIRGPGVAAPTLRTEIVEGAPTPSTTGSVGADARRRRTA